MGLTAAMRWAQERAAGGQPPAALPYAGPINTPEASAVASSNTGVTIPDQRQPPAALPLSPEEKAKRRKALDEVSRLGYEMQVEEPKQPKARRSRKPKEVSGDGQG